MWNFISGLKALRENSVQIFLLAIWSLDVLKVIMKIFPKRLLDKEIKKPELKFNPGFGLIGLWTTGIWSALGLFTSHCDLSKIGREWLLIFLVCSLNPNRNPARSYIIQSSNWVSYQHSFIVAPKENISPQIERFAAWIWVQLKIRQVKPNFSTFQRYRTDWSGYSMRHSKETLERKRCYGEEIPKTNRSGEAMSSGGEETKNL